MDQLELGEIEYGQIITAIYLKVSISDFLTLFSARTGDDYFWSSRPAPILMYACCFSLTISTIIAVSWPHTYPDDIETEGLLVGGHDDQALFLWVWFYCLIWWLLQDILKVWAWRIMKVHNILKVNDSGKVVYSTATLEKIDKVRHQLTSEQNIVTRHV